MKALALIQLLLQCFVNGSNVFLKSVHHRRTASFVVNNERRHDSPGIIYAILGNNRMSYIGRYRRVSIQVRNKTLMCHVFCIVRKIEKTVGNM